MRRIFVPFVLLFALMFAGCTYDDSELVERIEELERSNNVSTLREQVESLTKSITALETLSAKFDELSSKNSADILDLGIEFEQLQEYVEERLDRVETHTAWLEEIIDGKIEDALSGGADTGGNIAGLRLWVEGTFATLDQYAALVEDINKIKSDLNKIQNEVNASFDNVDSKIEELNSDVQELKDIVNNLEEVTQYDYIIEQFADIHSHLIALDVNISDLDNRLNDVEQHSELLESDIEYLYAAIEEMKNEFTVEYKSVIEDVIMENGGVIDAKIEAELEEVNAHVDAELESIKERIDGLEQRIDDLEYALDKIKALDIVFDIEDGVACMAGASIEFGYTIVGGDDDTEVESFGDGGWSADVMAIDATSGRIRVMASKDGGKGKVIVLATSGIGASTMKSIRFDAGIITDIMDRYETSYKASTLAVTLKTNLEYDVEISAEAQSWISCADTRAELREDTLSFTIEENLYDEPRTAVIHLVGALGDKLQSFEIVQQKSPLNAPIQFADQNVKRVCVEKFDTNGDGELSYKEAAAVTEIGDEAYYISFFGGYAAAVKSFDELQYFINLTTIGNSAFSGCSSLTSVTIPDSVTTIGYDVFYSCSSLTSVTIPDSVTTIGDGAFSGCSNLTAFYGKFASEDNRCWIVDGVLNSFAPSGLTAYNIPDSVTTIGYRAFYYCSSLTSVTIPDSVTSIGVQAFGYCSSLTSVYCKPITPPVLGDNAVFGHNASGRKIYVPASEDDSIINAYKSAVNWSEYADDIYEIQPSKNEIWYTNGSTTEATTPHYSNVFGDVTIQSNLYDTEKGCWVITFDGDVTTIRDHAFQYCTSLTSVTIPDSVTTIGDKAFYSCDSLTSVTIPDSVTTIGEGAFSGCSSLKEFKGKFAADGGRCLIMWNTIIAYAEASGTTYTILDSVTTIGVHAFAYCNSLTSVTIPDSVTTIGYGAFCECASLTSVTIPDGVTTIGDWAFYNCENLTSVTIPDSVTTIGDYAFYNCDGLTSVTIPDSVTSIDGYAFGYCSSLTSVYCKPITPPTGYSGMFGNNASGRKIYVPAESVGAYKSAAYWSNYADAIVGYDFGNAGITDWNNVYVRSAFDDCKVLMMEASGFTGEFYLHKLGAKKSDALAAAVYTVGAWEYTTSRDYCEDAVSKINGVTLKSGEVVVETAGDGYKVTFNVVDQNGTEWKGTYTGGITQP